MPKAIGLVTCNYTTASNDDVFSGRPVASMPYLGRYRLVDFALSNMVNAGIRNVGMIMPNNYRSLVDHVGSGKHRLWHQPHRRSLPHSRPRAKP